MAKHYTAVFLRMLRNQIPIDAVIVDLLNLELRSDHKMLRFRCPLCHGFHTATNHETNLARCFDCQKNFVTTQRILCLYYHLHKKIRQLAIKQQIQCMA